MKHLGIRNSMQRHTCKIFPTERYRIGDLNGGAPAPKAAAARRRIFVGGGGVAKKTDGGGAAGAA